MSEARNGWSVIAMLVVALGCTVGETPPPTPAPAEGPVPAEPVGEPGEPGPQPEEAEAVASALLAEAQALYDAGQLEEALRQAERVVSEHDGSAAADEAQWLAARAAFALERYEEAQRLSEAYAEGDPGAAEEREAEELAQLAEDAREAGASAVVGVVLPRSGSRVLVQYADWLLEGIELAVRQAERTQGRQIELVIVDDRGGTATADAVRELERRGAVAIVGPLLPEQVMQAASARSDPDLILVSPTVPATPGALTETYSLNSDDTRGARELAAYAVEAGWMRAAMLYPRTPEYQRKAQAFAEEFELRGGAIRATVPYDSGTTTFEDHMKAILSAASGAGGGIAGEPVPYASGADTTAGGRTGAAGFALFIAAPERDIRQIAPQLTFYGLDSAGVQVLGDAAWAGSVVRRVVPARDLEGVIAASHFPPDRADAPADPEFIGLYEDAYRRSLQNQLPALGYDAANLVLQALPNRLLTPGAVARRFGLLTGIRGATGLLSVRADQVVRVPYLVRIRGGKLEPAPSPTAAGGGPGPVDDGGADDAEP